MRINADLRTKVWGNKRGGGSFRPYGQKVFVGRQYLANPETWGSDESIAGRLFIGLNVGGKPTWTIDDVSDRVKRLRKEHKRRPDSSYILQKGIYTSQKSGEIIDEESVQVVIFNMDESTTVKMFEQEMLELAEHLADELDQEEIVVDIQKNGLSVRTFGVEPIK